MKIHDKTNSSGTLCNALFSRVLFTLKKLRKTPLYWGITIAIMASALNQPTLTVANILEATKKPITKSNTNINTDTDTNSQSTPESDLESESDAGLKNIQKSTSENTETETLNAATEDAAAIPATNTQTDITTDKTAQTKSIKTQTEKAKTQNKDINELETTLQDVFDLFVVTATKNKQTIESAPSIIDVVTSQEIRQRGYKTVAQAIESMAGLFVIDDHLYHHVGVRGVFGGAESASDIIKVMINGQVANFRPTSGNFLGHEFIPIDAVKRIEVVRGPGSALYGANAFLGVINIITFQGADFAEKDNHSSITGNSYYTQNSQNKALNGGASFVSGLQHRRFEYLLSGNFNYADRSGLRIPGHADMANRNLHNNDPENYDKANNYPSPGWNDDVNSYMLKRAFSKNDSEHLASAYGIASYNFNSQNKLSLDTSIQYFNKHGEFQGFSALTHENRLTYANAFARLLYTKDTPDGLSLTISMTFSGGKPTNQEYIVDYLAPSSHKKRKMGYRAFDAVVEGTYVFNRKWSVTLGTDASHDVEDLLSMEVTSKQTGDSYEEEGFSEKNFVNWGLYNQWQFNPIKTLGFTAGLRMDFNNEIACDAQQWDCIGKRQNKQVTEWSALGEEQETTIKDRGVFQLSSRLGIVYHFPIWGLYTKALYGSSFKPPSPYQLYHRDWAVAGSRGYPYLKPQSSDTLEFVLGKKTQNLHISTNYFLTLINDIVTPVKEGEKLENRNADIMTHGIEGTISYQWQAVLSTFLNATYIINNEMRFKKRSTETDFEWQYSRFNTTLESGMYPNLLINFGFNLNFPKQHINLNLNTQIVGKRSASVTNNQLYDYLDLQKTYQFQSYFLANLVISSVDLFFWDKHETILSVALLNIPGNHINPGYGGIDIPSLGPKVLFSATQQF